MLRELSPGRWTPLILAALLLILAGPSVLAAGPTVVQTADGLRYQPGPGMGRDCTVGPVSGTVTLPDGSPAAGAKVIVTSEHVTTIVSAADDGRYHIRRLCAGEQRAFAYRHMASGFSQGTYDRNGDGQPDVFELTADSPRADGIDITLGTASDGPWPITPSCDPADGALSGLVHDEDGAPVADAEIIISGEETFVVTFSGPDGRYAVDGLCPSEHPYHLFAHGRLADGTMAHGFHDPNRDHHPDTIELTPEAPTREDADIVLYAPRSMPGGGPRIPDCDDPAGTVEGTVYDAEGNPVADAEVNITNGAGFSRRGRTDADGHYRVEELCDGEYHAFATVATTMSRLHGFYDPDGDGVPNPITLDDASRTATGIDIVLMAPPRRPNPGPRPGCDDPQAAIEGTVTDSDGAPVRGAHVEAFTVVARHNARTDANGDYRLAGLCAGEYEVLAHAPNGALGVYDPNGDGRPDPVSVSDDSATVEDIDIVIERVMRPRPPQQCRRGPGSISGTVFGPDGDPVARAEVAVATTNRMASTRTRGDGSYRVDGLCPGEYLALAYVLDGTTLLAGLYDADGDGDPDIVTLTDDTATAEDIDVTLAPVGTSGVPDLAEMVRCVSGTAPGGVTTDGGTPVLGRGLDIGQRPPIRAVVERTPLGLFCGTAPSGDMPHGPGDRPQ